MARGGRRTGAGRKKGGKNAATLLKERVLSEVRQRIMRNAQRLIDSQLSLANGQQFLYVIHTQTTKAGKTTRSKPELVTDPETIARYLDGEFGDGERANDSENFYYITTREPQNIAVDSMMNRAFGRPTETVELSGGDGGPLVFSWQQQPQS